MKIVQGSIDFRNTIGEALITIKDMGYDLNSKEVIKKAKVVWILIAKKGLSKKLENTLFKKINTDLLFINKPYNTHHMDKLLLTI